MHIWDYDIGTLKKTEEAERWALERAILYGLNGQRIPRNLLMKHLPHLRIPEDRRTFLMLLLDV